MKHPYLYPLCIQLPAAPDPDNPEFLRILGQLQARGFYGVELNLLDFSEKGRQRLQTVLDAHGLKLTMIASGAYAKQNGLSLSSTDETARAATVDALEKILKYAGKCGAGVICGFLKGGPDGNHAVCAAQMRRSLDELAGRGALECAPLYLEATNHYEALLVNTVAEGAAFAREAGGPVQVLPDTYHMNIEECSPVAALSAYGELFRNLHISDNNRYYPGFGAIDFHAVLRALRGLNYNGTITIEGRNFGSLAEDIDQTCAYLSGAAQRAAREIAVA
ncbi:sugar phosphate isomerase/epimerase family protein [Anaerotruncus rubiinfantis]|uniref:sugar phosphate isomerase/epimerase family protein n=1 Tax=Anaerotruncus rubiinfantis TaxID=1720200 RepID=UPI00189ADA5E|nr:sugar phosphate isomerase/epimerase [Anaerotruncus rubiinfantis]